MTTYFATLTFDLNDADSSDYQTADESLAAVGLRKVLQGSNGPVTLPANTYAGEFPGTDAASVRDSVRQIAKQALSKLRPTGRLFVAIGGDWNWGTTGF